MVKVTKDSVRRTLRTTIAVTVAVATAVPLLVEAGVLRVDPADAPWLASIVAVAAGITRLMADPRVDALLGRVLGASWTRDGVITPAGVGQHRADVPPDLGDDRRV